MFTEQDAINQAYITANSYFMDAVLRIDEMFHQGYAAKHPELVAEYMKTCSHDLEITYRHMEMEVLSSNLNNIADALRQDEH